MPSMRETRRGVIEARSERQEEIQGTGVLRLGRLALAATALLWAWLAAANAASASADGCTQYTNPNREFCWYAGESVPRYTARWFSAPGGNNLRNWDVNEVTDGYGGGVLKCAGIKREGSGVGTWVACGTQAVVGAGFEAYPRSWIFVEQWANGPRVIAGLGKRWYGPGI